MDKAQVQEVEHHRIFNPRMDQGKSIIFCSIFICKVRSVEARLIFFCDKVCGIENRLKMSPIEKGMLKWLVLKQVGHMEGIAKRSRQVSDR